MYDNYVLSNGRQDGYAVEGVRSVARTSERVVPSQPRLGIALTSVGAQGLLTGVTDLSDPRPPPLMATGLILAFALVVSPGFYDLIKSAMNARLMPAWHPEDLHACNVGQGACTAGANIGRDLTPLFAHIVRPSTCSRA